jgi:dihydroflavonol-4-reductase
MAERAAWDFVEKLPEDEKFELVCINPGLVLGPNLNSANFSSGDIISNFLLGKMPGIPHSQMQLVDVRDVAQAHLNAILIPEAAGNRFLLVQGSYWFKDISTWLQETQGADYPKIPKKVLSKWMINVASWFMEDAKFAKSVWGKEPKFDNSKTKELLKIPFREMPGTVQDMAVTLIETGYVVDQRKNKPESEKKEEEPESEKKDEEKE